jgi:hypothetical protein
VLASHHIRNDDIVSYFRTKLEEHTNCLFYKEKSNVTPTHSHDNIHVLERIIWVHSTVLHLLVQRQSAGAFLLPKKWILANIHLQTGRILMIVSTTTRTSYVSLRLLYPWEGMTIISRFTLLSNDGKPQPCKGERDNRLKCIVPWSSVGWLL